VVDRFYADGAASDLNWTSAAIVDEGTFGGQQYIDVKFTAKEGDMHWVIFSGLAGAYQYFVNHALPQLGEFRTLWRLDNTSFPNGKTDIRDEPLPPLSDYLPENKVQDETWLRPDGSGYLTKYDLSTWVRTQTYYGVYGSEFGSWYINAGKDYYNGNHLKQELFVHRESKTGDAVLLNMIHGTHFQVSAVDDFPDGKMWGPWLWYLNEGSKSDAEVRATSEFDAWPYEWLKNDAYHSRGSVKGKLTLSDGRPAAKAAVFLGDNGGNKTTLDQGSDYYYTAYADDGGNFEFHGVRAATYGFYAWSNGSKIADVSTSFAKKDVVVSKDKATDMGGLTWTVSPKKKLFQVGDFDRRSLGFKYGGAPYEHALADKCPGDLTYTVGKSATVDWCFGQTKPGNWSINFTLDQTPSYPRKPSCGVDAGSPVLIISLAGYSAGTSSNVYVNEHLLTNLTSGSPRLLNDPSLYRSATTAGEWRYFELPFDVAWLKAGINQITFAITQNSTIHGFMWDSIILEW
jgi:rhamnogalacturonan endolyase